MLFNAFIEFYGMIECFSVIPLYLSIDILIPRLYPKQGETRGVSLEMLSLQNVWINEGDVHLSHIPECLNVFR